MAAGPLLLTSAGAVGPSGRPSALGSRAAAAAPSGNLKAPAVPPLRRSLFPRRSALRPQQPQPAGRNGGGRALTLTTSASLVEGSKGQDPQLEAKIMDAVYYKKQLVDIDLQIGQLIRKGKVRDVYDSGDYIISVTSDRQSAFDRVLCAVPFKGQVLNQTTVWWFNNTQHIIPNAMVASPHPYATVMRKAEVFQVEFVMRGYMTGSTETSILTQYNNGCRNYCGNPLPDGLVKSQKLPENLLTPTTKGERDIPIDYWGIIREGLMNKEDLDVCAKAAKELFAFGQQEAAKRGLILVDTKYEFGKLPDGTIVLIDEVHTPDSSRYWVASTYEERFRSGQAPENIDKEFLRLWFRDNCDPYRDAVLPEAPAELVAELSRRYILLYETITGAKMQFAEDFYAGPNSKMASDIRQCMGSLPSGPTPSLSPDSFDLSSFRPSQASTPSQPTQPVAQTAGSTSTGPLDVTIVLGSRSDLPVAEKALKILDQFNIKHQIRVASAHRAPKYLEDIVKAAEGNGCKVFIGMAGVAAALPGVLASMTCKPVIGVPCGGKVPFDSLLSIVQMPPGMPVATVGTDRGDNAAVLAVQILAAFDPQLAATFAQYRTDMTNNVIKDDEKTVSEYSRSSQW